MSDEIRSGSRWRDKESRPIQVIGKYHKYVLFRFLDTGRRGNAFEEDFLRRFTRVEEDTTYP